MVRALTVADNVNSNEALLDGAASTIELHRQSTEVRAFDVARTITVKLQVFDAENMHQEVLCINFQETCRGRTCSLVCLVPPYR